MNLALNAATTSSSDESSAYSSQHAVDGDLTTRWSSAPNNTAEWLQINLGARYAINEVKLYWEAAYATGYQIQVSDDATTWTPIYTTTVGAGGTEDLTNLSGSGHYIRINATVHNVDLNFSLYEVEVYGTAAV